MQCCAFIASEMNDDSIRGPFVADMCQFECESDGKWRRTFSRQPIS